MALTRDSLLYYWDAGYGTYPVIGGDPVLTRAAAGWTHRPGGHFDQEGNDKPRFERVEVNGKWEWGMLLEPERENLTPDADAQGAPSGMTVTPAAGYGPDGKPRLTKVSESGANERHFVLDTLISTSAGSTYCFSRFFKQGTRRYIKFAIHISTINEWSVIYDWQTDTYTVTSTGSALTFVDAGVERYPGGFVRPWISATASGVTNSYALHGTLDALETAPNYAFQGSTSEYLWAGDLQVEIGKRPTTQILTTGSPLTRNADAFHWGRVLPPVDFVAYHRFVEGAPGEDRIRFGMGRLSDLAAGYMAVMDGAAGPLGGYRAYHRDPSGATVSTDPLAEPAFGETVEHLFQHFSDGSVQLHQRVEGGSVLSTPVTGVPGTPPAMLENKVTIGGSSTGTYQGRGLHFCLKVAATADLDGITAEEQMDELAALTMDPFGNILS